MNLHETEHYRFFFQPGSVAEKEIIQIAEIQEEAYERITSFLQVIFPSKINYHFYDTPEEVGIQYGDDEPCNGFARYPNDIYAVYNDKVKCIGPHEDTHIIAAQINIPNCVFLKEGLAMKADETWWGIETEMWCRYFLDHDEYLSVASLFQKQYFFANGCEITYPIAGAFVNWMIHQYSLETFLELYKKDSDYVKNLEKIVRKSISEIEYEFLQYIKTKNITKEILEKIEYERSK